MSGIVVGAVLTAAPALGTAPTVWGMIRAFNTLEKSGTSDPQALASNVGEAMLFTSLGIELFPVGVVMLVLSIYYYGKARAENPPPE